MISFVISLQEALRKQKSDKEYITLLDVQTTIDEVNQQIQDEQDRKFENLITMI